VIFLEAMENTLLQRHHHIMFFITREQKFFEQSPPQTVLTLIRQHGVHVNEKISTCVQELSPGIADYSIFHNQILN
jgi:hypothetical protein